MRGRRDVLRSRSDRRRSEMASILQFVPLEESKPRRRREPTGNLGEVVIFPGVRIERHDDAPEARSETPRKQAQKS